MATSPRPEPFGDEPTEKLDPISRTEDPMDRTEQESTHDQQDQGTDPAADRPADETTRDRTSVRVGTVVWGLVLAAVGLGVLALASGLTFDVELAFIGLVAVAGLALLVGSLINGARRSRR